MDKRGVELSMNIIIIAIILILVLVVLVGFFIGGFTGLVDRIGRVAPDNIETSVQDCESKCLLAQTFTSDNAKEKSSYCRTEVKFDSDGDNKADELHHCWSNDLDVICPGIEELCVSYSEPVEKIGS